MLGTDLLTLAALQAVSSLCDGLGLGSHRVIAAAAVDLGEDIRNGDSGGTAISAVAAGGAGDLVLSLIKSPHLGNGLLLGIGQRLEILHIAGSIGILRYTANGTSEVFVVFYLRIDVWFIDD